MGSSVIIFVPAEYPPFTTEYDIDVVDDLSSL